MKFWEYDIGDEIRINNTIDGKPTGRVSTYKVIDRYIKRPTLGFVWKSTMLDRYYVLYYVNDGNLYNKNESDVNELVWKCDGIVIRKHDEHKGSGRMKYNVGDEVRFNGTVYRITNVIDDNYVIRDEINRMDFNIPCPTIDIHAIAIKKPEESTEKSKDPAVDHPSYYQGKIEVIDFIEDKHLGFNLGNCVKYISRHQLKHKDNPVEDLKKARWYLDREISRIEGASSK